MEIEIWKDISEYKWRYQVSNLWNIKSLNYAKSWKEKILKIQINKYWYLHIVLRIKWIKSTLLVSRIVAKAFISNPDNKPQVNHKNWIKIDNRVENLEWTTRSENQLHAFANWLKKNHHFYTNHPSLWKLWKDHFNSKKVFQFTKDWEFIREWYSLSDVFRELWFSQWNISYCCNWKKKTTGGYIWKYNK